MIHYWPNIWAIIFAIVLGLTSLPFFGAGIAARQGQDQLEAKRKEDGTVSEGPNGSEESQGSP